MENVKDSVTFSQPKITYLPGHADAFVITGLETRFIYAARQWLRLARAQQKVQGRADFVKVTDIGILQQLARVVEPPAKESS